MIHGLKRSRELWISYLAEDLKRVRSIGLVRRCWHLTLYLLCDTKQKSSDAISSLNPILLMQLSDTVCLVHWEQVRLNPSPRGLTRKQAIPGVVAEDQVLIREMVYGRIGARCQTSLWERRDKVVYRKQPESGDGFVVTHLAVVRAERD